MKAILENNELESMRLQMETLQKKLEQQELVNDQMIRKAMDNKFSSMTRYIVVSLCACMFAIPYMFWMFTNIIDMSWAFIAFTELLFLAAFVWRIVCYRQIKSLDFINDSLVNAKKNILRLKLNDQRQKYISFPFLAVFTIWFFIETHMRYGWAFTIGGIVGAIISLSLGIWMHRSYNKTRDEVIKELEELTEE